MPRGRAETVIRETRGGPVEMCACGKRIGAPNHNRRQCLFWLKKDPSPGAGYRNRWDIPDRLYEESEPARVSRQLERYLDFWNGRYQRCLESLERRSPDQAWVFVEHYHHDRRLVDLAKERGVPVGTVRSWKSRALAHMRRASDITVSLEVAPDHDPSVEAAQKEREELIRINAEAAAGIAARAAVAA